MFGFQGGYQQQPPPQDFNQGPQRTGPPPAKKPKSQPIITRYPPPPGYRGPGQPQAPFQRPTWQQPQPTGWQQPPLQSWQQPQQTWHQNQQASWQQPQPSYGYGQPTYPGYQAQGYQANPQIYQQSHSQPQFPGYNTQPHPQHVQSSQTFYVPPTRSMTTPTPSAFQHSTDATSAAHRHSSVSFDSQGKFVPPQISASDDLEQDFDAECYFASHPEDIIEELSLGFIHWEAALPTKRVLPATFAEAELEALAPRKPFPPDEESVSDYYVKAKRYETLLSVRQTDAWEKVKDDILFQEFSDIPTAILSKSELIAKYRDRSDAKWTTRAQSSSPDPEDTEIKVEGAYEDASEGAMDGVTSASPRVKIKSEDIDGRGEEVDLLDSLEGAISQQRDSSAAAHSRSNSIASVLAQNQDARPKPIMPVRDVTQEAKLAALGVTGAPKMHFQTPGPAIGSPPPEQFDNMGRLVRQNSATSHLSNTDGVPPPPPPPPGHPPAQKRKASNHSWAPHGQPYSNGDHLDRPNSRSSQHTAVGSDFHPDDGEATPRPKSNHNESRKRAHSESENGDVDGVQFHSGDDTPKQRRIKEPRVDDAFKRRW